jgi:peptide deformylase
MTRLKGKARAKANRKKRNKHKNDFFVKRKSLIGEIRKYDDPDLAMICEDVTKDDAINIESVFKKMEQVLNVTKNGVGLAASQIGIPAKMIIIKSDSDSRKITRMINPQIESTSKEMKFGREGCLSYPETSAFIERFVSVEVSYFDENWKKHTVEYKKGDFLGIVIQHELEHLEEGHCQVYGWWKDPEGKKKELEERFKKPEKETSNNDVVESEDMKREKEEAKVKEAKDKRAVEVTKEALKRNDFVDEDGNPSPL